MTETLSNPTSSLVQEISSLGPWFHNRDGLADELLSATGQKRSGEG